MSNGLFFQPEDFDSIITYEYFVEILIGLINEIRSNNIVGQKLIADIKKLQLLSEKEEFKRSKDVDNIESLFQIYEQIKNISMEIRKLLPSFLNLNLYDSISYALYYNGKRYVVDEIDTSWLTKGDKGSLLLDLEKMANDLDKDYSEGLISQLRQLFNEHYATYLAAISGMYKKTTGYSLGTKRLNRGHVAEAYESHIAGHHTKAYNIMNSPYSDNNYIKAIIAHESAELGDDYWATHESPDSAWGHIRGALGTQRGTVAGDVGKFQVKQGFKSQNIYTSKVRLSSMANLERGVKDYCDIINPDIEPEALAKRLATYLSERVSHPTKELQAHIANQEFGKLIQEFSKTRIIHI